MQLANPPSWSDGKVSFEIGLLSLALRNAARHAEALLAHRPDLAAALEIPPAGEPLVLTPAQAIGRIAEHLSRVNDGFARLSSARAERRHGV